MTAEISREEALRQIELANSDDHRDEFIEIIEAHYPVDSQYDKTRKTGIKLLSQAIFDDARATTPNWRDLPASVLQRYAEYCDEQEIM
tara:strand:- start:6 stop:269 length:264 start_codon:yes stop_codon:yes gene_type:complete